jgi:Glycosyl hydrolase family 26
MRLPTYSWLAVVPILCLAGCGAAARKAGDAPQVVAEPPPGQFYFGVFPGSANGMGSDVSLAGVAAFGSAAGKRPTWVYFCDNWYEGRAFPWSTASWIRAGGSVPYIRMMLLSSSAIPTPDPVFNLANIERGMFDADLHRWMRDARRFGSPLIAEYGVEVNGFWFPWNGLWNKDGGSYAEAIASFRRAYRRIVRIARQEGALNIRWVFHVDPWDEPVAPWNHFESYYPGDEWIDWVGVSVYGRQLPKGKYRPTFRYQMDWAYGRLAAIASKPVVVCEFGTVAEEGQEAWARAALSDLTGGRWPRVIGFAWWNSAFHNDPADPSRESEMRIQNSPGLPALFHSFVGDNGKVLSTALLAPARRR